MDFSALDNFSLTGNLEELWCTTRTDGNNEEMMAGEPSSDPSVSPISSSGSEERSVAVEILPPFPQGDETLTSLFSDDFPSLDIMLGNEFLGSDNQVKFSYKPNFTSPVNNPDKKAVPLVEDADVKVVDAGCDMNDAMKNRRNAIAAKKNRERKKAQFNALEREVEQLKAENDSYKKRCTALESGILTLNKELEYYKAVLANESVLSKLLQNIPNVSGINLTTSLGVHKRQNGTSPARPAKRIKSSNGQLNPSTGGICLHVANDNVSLEFCSTCSSQAAIASSVSSSSTPCLSSTINSNNENTDNEQES